MRAINLTDKIIVTGAAGFIASCVAMHLNELGFTNLILVDDFNAINKLSNWKSIQYAEIVERDFFFSWLKAARPQVTFFVHLGARTDTTEFNYSIHEKLNVDFSKEVWQYCTQNQVPLIYASSAATYGMGAFGFDDDHDAIPYLAPLNPYGVSKNEFDKWALKENKTPPFWAGLKFFNVYGPGEYHKGNMASVIFHAFRQVQQNKVVKLFRSHNALFADGQQLRDFIYVKDIMKIITWMMDNKPSSGIYNIGTGKARSFTDLVNAVYLSLNKTPTVEFIDMPESMRPKYQYFTEAKMDKLRNQHYNCQFYSLEEGIKDYIQSYLINGALYNEHYSPLAVSA